MTAARIHNKGKGRPGSFVGPDGLADVVPTDQGSVPSLRRLAMYARWLIRAIGLPFGGLDAFRCNAGTREVPQYCISIPKKIRQPWSAGLVLSRRLPSTNA
jgi:hypothetical protein